MNGSAMCFHREVRRLNWRAFTLIELLVVISLITLLIALLLPVIARARDVAQLVHCQSNVRQIHVALTVYANDHDTFTPDEPPHNGADWTPNDGRSVASVEIWGLTRPRGLNLNAALGLGQLVELNYTIVEGLFCPTEMRRFEVFNGYAIGPGFWSLRGFFGESYRQPWRHPDSGEPWSPWWGESNYFFKSSYAYRSNDWSTPFQERRDNKHLSTIHEEYNDHVVVMDKRGSLHNQIGCNVLWGDGAVLWWNDDEVLNYTIPWVGPTYPTSGGWHSGFLTHLMYMADGHSR